MININVDDVYKLERFRKRLFWSPQHTLYKVCNFESDYNNIPSRVEFLQYVASLKNVPNLVLPIDLLKDLDIFGYEIPYVDNSTNINEYLYQEVKDIDIKRVIISLFDSLQEIHKYFIFNDIHNGNILIKDDHVLFVDWDLGIKLDSLEIPPTCYSVYELASKPTQLEDITKALICALCIYYKTDIEIYIESMGIRSLLNFLISINANKEIINCISLIISAYKHNQTTIDFDFSEMFESISLPSKKEVRKIRKRINY